MCTFSLKTLPNLDYHENFKGKSLRLRKHISIWYLLTFQKESKDPFPNFSLSINSDLRFLFTDKRSGGAGGEGQIGCSL